MSASGSNRPDRPNIAVDLRALVPTATGIGVYTRSLLARLIRMSLPALDLLVVATKEGPGVRQVLGA